MKYENSELASQAWLVADALRLDYGVDPAPLLAKVGISKDELSAHGGRRVAYDKVQLLWQLAVDTSGDPGFGFRVGERASPYDYGVLGCAFMSSTTLLAAFNVTCRYMTLISTAAVGYDIETTSDTVAMIETFPDPALVRHPCADDALQVALMRLMEKAARKPIHPLRVELYFPEDGKAAEYERLYQCPIEYDAHRVRLEFAREDMVQPLPGAHPSVFSALDQVAAQELELLDSQTTSALVRRELLRLLPSGDADQDHVAANLNRSRATLQRQLSTEGTNFRKVFDATRRDVAETYLRAGKYSLAEVAFLAGFSDQSSFGRAFRRWTGVSPGRFRKRRQ